MVRRDATRYKRTYSYRREEPRTAEDVCAVCNTILNGVGPPADSLGLIDDLYIDTLAMELYGPKPSDAGPWGTPIPLASSSGVASPVDSVQYNGGGYFLGSSAFTFVSGNLYLTGTLSQGNLSVALGQYSHAEGYNTVALGDSSHAAGYYTIASGSYQNVVGQYNRRNNSDSLFIVGNGTGNPDVDRSDILLVNPGSVMIGSASLGTDTFLYVGTSGVATVATFAGDTYVSGTGRFEAGLSGSLTQLVDGTSYIRAGAAITVTTGSGGWIEIASTAVTTPGGATTQVQFNNSNAFAGDSTFTFNKDTDTLSVQNVVVAGDLTVNGTFVTVNATNLEVHDSVIGLGFASGTLATPAGDRGLIMGLKDEDNVALLWKEAADEFALARTAISSTGSLPIALNSYSNLQVANLQGAIITASLGFSGSLTKLVDGSDYLRAGANITLTTGALGQVEIGTTGLAPVGASYLTLGLDGSLTNERVLTMGTGFLATDGGANSSYTIGINDGVVATISGSTFTGVVKFNEGLSGSLTKLTNGDDYLVAGDYVVLTTGALGQIEIDVTGVAPVGAQYLTLVTDSTLTNERALAMGTGLVSTDGGAGGSFTIGINNGVVATISGSTFTGAVKFNEGLSGSLTKLVDGSDYLKAGANITLTTGALGQVEIGAIGLAPVGASYLTLGLNGSLTDERVLTMGTGLVSTDGGANGNFTIGINDGVVATISGSTFTGVVNFNQGLSGSLTKLVNDDDYLVAGTGISLSTGSNGSITISSKAAGFDTQVQFNDSNSFNGDSSFTFNKNSNTLSVENAVVSGDLTVNGTMTTVNSVNLEVKDSVIGLGFSSGTISEVAGDRGIIVGLRDVDHATFLWKNTDSEFVIGRTQSSATGSLPIALTSYSNLHVANLQALIVTASLGFSGSLTKLVDGSDYLLAGAGISLLTSSTGQVEISTTGLAPSTAQYLTLSTNGSLTNERQFTVSTGLNAQDSGAGGLYTLSINDSVVATISGSTFAGVVNFNQGLSGSLTKLTSDEDYLVAGAGISLSTGSNGSITISSTSITTPGSPNTGIQFNSGGTFGASANFTFANNIVYLSGSISNGNQTEASGQSTHAEGYLTTASYLYAHSEGYDTLALGEASHVEGKWSEAIGSWSHAEGVLSVAGGSASHAEGSGSLAAGAAAHSEGHLTSAPSDYSHAEGWATIASGSWSHAEGCAAITSGSWSHAEGVFTIARGEGSHAEGSGSLASGVGSHAEGKDSTALGDFSHAGGLASLASGYAATSIGSGSIAAGNFSFAAGEYTIASGSAQSVFGKFNKTFNPDSLFVIGNGYDNFSRSDILIVNTGSVLIGSASIAADTFFYVGTNPGSSTARFDGDVVVSGTLNVKNGNDLSTLSVVGSKVGIGTSSPGYELEVIGEFAATVKSFVVSHPNKQGWKLRHGTLEGPENGVYVRGRSKERTVKLPDYWENFVDEDSITVHITPIKMPDVIYVISTSIHEFTVDCARDDIEYYYVAQAARIDHTFEVEYQE